MFASPVLLNWFCLFFHLSLPPQPYDHIHLSLYFTKEILSSWFLLHLHAFAHHSWNYFLFVSLNNKSFQSLWTTEANTGIDIDHIHPCPPLTPFAPGLIKIFSAEQSQKWLACRLVEVGLAHGVTLCHVMGVMGTPQIGTLIKITQMCSSYFCEILWTIF